MLWAGPITQPEAPHPACNRRPGERTSACRCSRLPLSGSASTSECRPPAATLITRQCSGPPGSLSSTGEGQSFCAPVPSLQGGVQGMHSRWQGRAGGPPFREAGPPTGGARLTSRACEARLAAESISRRGAVHLPKAPRPQMKQRPSSVTTMVCVPPQLPSITRWPSSALTCRAGQQAEPSYGALHRANRPLVSLQRPTHHRLMLVVHADAAHRPRWHGRASACGLSRRRSPATRPPAGPTFCGRSLEVPVRSPSPSRPYSPRPHTNTSAGRRQGLRRHAGRHEWGGGRALTCLCYCRPLLISPPTRPPAFPCCPSAPPPKPHRLPC